MGIGAHDHVLEIGRGWGGFALHAARATGCRVTGLTISREQYSLARQRVRDAGLADRIDVQHRDYRDVQGTFDKIVSIEMFEAVGRNYWSAFFRASGRALHQGGSMLLQTIAIPDAKVHKARRASGWISTYIFPGGMLPAVVEIEDSLREGADALVIRDVNEIGPQYVRTLDEWRQRFWGSIHRVRALGFDERFVRMWGFYLASCSAAFAARHIRDVQVVIGERSGRANLGLG